MHFYQQRKLNKEKTARKRERVIRLNDYMISFLPKKKAI
jgi:hypothetical protein